MFFQVLPKIKQIESVADDEEGLSQEIYSVIKNNKPMVFIRHYSFIDFERSGLAWRPDWFNIVRDPIDKVKYRSRLGFLVDNSILLK